MGEKTLIANNNGIALVTVILFVMVLSLCWFTFSELIGREGDLIQNEMQSSRALYLAEAGIQQALGGLSQDWDWKSWPDNRFPNGSLGSSGTAYTWTGTVGESGQNYTVSIRDDGLVQSRIVSTGTVGAIQRTVEVELGSAFDFGLYSHDRLDFQSGFSVTGSDGSGYVYAKDGIGGLGTLTADKTSGNFTGGPGNFYFFPKEVPLPEAWTPVFSAWISGVPSSTTVGYTNDAGEENLEPEALLHNKTRDNVRTIRSVDAGTKTITTDTSTDNWADGDEIVLKRISRYENQWSAFNQELEGFDNAPSPPPYDETFNNFKGRISGAPSSTLVYYANDTGEGNLRAGALLHNTIRGNYRTVTIVDTFSNTITTNITYDNWQNGDMIEADLVFKSATPQFPSGLNASADFIAPAPATVNFFGDTTFSGTVRVNGNAVFGRLYDSSHGSTIINGDMVIHGNAYFFNRIEINGHLYVTGSVHVEDHANNYVYYNTGDNVYVVESASQIDGILVQADGGLFVRDGTLYLKKNEALGGFQINDYCYVYGDITIASNLEPPPLVINLPTDPATNRAIYAKNGSLTVGSAAYPQDLSGSGKIIVGHNATMSRDLRADDSDNPLILMVMNDFDIRGKIGASSLNPFHGLIYSAGTVSRPAAVSPATYVCGTVIAAYYSDFFHGGSVDYSADMKQSMPDLSFLNTKDYVRPLIWRETN
ncbi:MAG: hypothetical protein JXD19_00770 [Deltaproteobacteria bacterium]|nr:hypothetical protein [Deltaproteobacteria bacterium]